MISGAHRDFVASQKFLASTYVTVEEVSSLRVTGFILDVLILASILELLQKGVLISPLQVSSRYWVPINWALNVAMKAYSKNYIESSPSLNFLLKEILDFRTSLALLCNYDWVPIPIAYPQVVFLAVRSYFLICLVSRQSLIGDGAPAETTIDIYVPFMTMLQFLFFVAWMKVAEALLNPLGEDDDDFECNFLIDRNIGVGISQGLDNSSIREKGHHCVLAKIEGG
uniref:Bestrophin homolog n=1 Tax=Angiostrongylus cantonensis TaxID=6313 RepID=A0A0K0DNY5_ANGCA